MKLCFCAWASFFFCELPLSSVERALCLNLPSHYSVCGAPEFIKALHPHKIGLVN